MSCLLQHFSCQPDTFSIHFTPHFHSTIHTQLSSRIKELYCFRAQCSLSLTSLSSSTSTAVLDLENPRLPSLEAHLVSLAPGRPWSYLGDIGPPNEVNFGATLATETLITSDEVVIAAVAAEAVALARAAVKVAKDVVLMVNSACSLWPETKNSISSITDSSPRWHQLTEAKQASIIGDSITVESEPQNESSRHYSFKELECLEPTNEELTLLEKKLSDGIAVKSRRYTERKARRVRAAWKAAASVMSVKSGTPSKKKRGAAQEVDYYEPLRYLRRTTSTSRLLTANEELELSSGIQV